MVTTLRTAFILSTAALGNLAFAQEQAARQLTARELFYSAVQTASAATPAKPQAKTPAPAAKKSTPPEVAHTPKKTSPAPGEPRSGAAALPDGATVIPALAGTSASGPPLGLRYSILKVSGERTVEVPPDTIFHAGDRIQIKVQPNLHGYLYIISQGSSGTWKPLFPSPELENGDNHVEALASYEMPPRSHFVFDEQTGTEKLFIVFSRAPEPNLEKLIYSLRGTRPGAPKPESPVKDKQLMLASNVAIDDATVGKLRAVYARDLIIEKVDESTPGKDKETAVYVVNTTGSSDSRVIADLRLVHQ